MSKQLSIAYGAAGLAVATAFIAIIGATTGLLATRGTSQAETVVPPPRPPSQPDTPATDPIAPAAVELASAARPMDQVRRDRDDEEHESHRRTDGRKHDEDDDD